MTRKNVDFSVLSVLPVRATELDSVEAVDEWLQSAG